jgi:hypothetical protein
MKVLLASFEPRRDRALAGWRFVRKPTRHASSRQFESQPTKTRGRYEHTLNARPNRTIRQFCVSELVPVVKIVADHHEPGIISRSWTEVPNGHVVDRLLGPSAAVLLDGENDGLSLVEPGENRVRHRCITAGRLQPDRKSLWPWGVASRHAACPKRARAAARYLGDHGAAGRVRSSGRHAARTRGSAATVVRTRIAAAEAVAT